MNAKQILCVLLAAALALSLCGCADAQALAFGARLVESMRDQTLTFTFELELERGRYDTRTLRGSGTATGLFGGDTLLAATGEVELRERTEPTEAEGRLSKSPAYRTSYSDARQIYYRDGVLYLADAAREALPPVNLTRVELSDALLAALTGSGSLTAVSDISISPLGGGRKLEGAVDPGSELGHLLACLFAALDDGTYGNTADGDTGYRFTLLTEPGGRLEQLDLTVERGGSAGRYELTLTLLADGYSDSTEAPTFPSYLG